MERNRNTYFDTFETISWVMAVIYILTLHEHHKFPQDYISHYSNYMSLVKLLGVYQHYRVTYKTNYTRSCVTPVIIVTGSRRLNRKENLLGEEASTQML